MNRNRILEIAEKLSQNTLVCVLTYIDKTNALDKINLNGNHINPSQLNYYFDKYRVGLDCAIEKLIFQPKDKEFLTFITNGVVTCSKYADEKEAETVIAMVHKILE